MATISAYQILKDGVRFHYPFIESCLAVLPIVDEFIFLEGYSGDGTYEELVELQKQHPKKVKIYRAKWYDTNPPCKIFRDMFNKCIELCQSEWHWQISADEIYHEDDLPLIKALTDDKDVDYYYIGKYDIWSNAFDKIIKYQKGDGHTTRSIRLARRNSYPYIHVIQDGALRDVLNVCRGKDLSDKIRFYHYSYSRSPKALKERANYMMRKFYNTKDRRYSCERVMPYSELLPQEKITSFDITRHPKIMEDWMKKESRGE